MIDKSKIAHLTIVVLVMMSATLANAAACTIPLDVTAASFTPGSGYGIDADEHARTAAILDAWLDAPGFVNPGFMLE